MQSLPKNSNVEFLHRKQVGDKGECFTMGYLYGKYEAAGYTVKNVEEYYTPGVYRWRGMCLPDFMLIDSEGNKTLVEVKCKQTYRGMLNISCKQVKDYLKVAELKGYDFFLLFFDMSQGVIYKLKPEDLKKPAVTIRKDPNDPFFLYDKEDKETLSQRIPKSLFNSDIINK